MLIHLPALVVALTVVLLFATAFAVGRARGRYHIAAPAITGHPAFERAWRVQMNTLEAAVMFLPSLWLASQYSNPSIAGVVGVVWLLARTWYGVAYTRDPGRRSVPFGIGMLMTGVLLVMGLVGVIRAFVLQG
jgi:uncharacterized MAPEG superfamily protein